ncbi:NAD(P)H-dependent oxidoreductase [uncultured Tateyamaria sp.]|uniref:FMN-dependent NADH-azoreductase n=1 Tax=uncultured Tateyamaria sp. TaxID=455651 RepID=UPI00262D6D22|nr:NAD(P)H-dependent oxidoreductase [uncultured Tateyamaria sp.]
MIRILHVNSSARTIGSASRAGGEMVVAALVARHEGASVTTREAAAEAAFLTEDWIEASFTSADARSGEQNDRLAVSDRLAKEVLEADILVLSVSMYNFNISGAMKTWIDQIARPGLTFRPDPEHTYVGLATGKVAYLVVATGETPIGGDMDFATPYLKHVLGFLGITDVTFVSADMTVTDNAAVQNKLEVQIRALFP